MTTVLTRTKSVFRVRAHLITKPRLPPRAIYLPRGGGQWKKERSPLCGLQLLPQYLHVGCLGDEVDRHPVQHILGLRISKRGHIIWEALALQQALHLLHDKWTRDSAGQSLEKEKEVNQMRLLLTPAFFTGSTTHMLSLVYFLTLQKGIV